MRISFIEILIAVFLLLIASSSGQDICGDLQLAAELNVEKISHPPGYPENHASYLDCFYTMRSPNGTRIRFSFDDFGIQNYGSFYVWLYDGGDTSSERFLILSQASDLGVMHHSKSSIMGVKLRVHINNQYTGFTMRYMAIASCGTRLEAYDDVQAVTSPGFPFKHLVNEICSWTIITAPDHVIEITANQISDETCCDNLQIIESVGNVRLTTGQVYKSPGKVVNLDFISNNSVQRRGFQISYKAVHVCGVLDLIAEIGEEKQTQQPPFPGLYPTTYLYCLYTVTSQEGTRIRFSFDDFGTQNYGGTFYLWFYDGMHEQTERFLILSKANEVGMVYYSKSNVMTMKLRVHKSYDYTGFSMTYTAIGACGSDLDADDDPQFMTSPGYPLQHLSNKICTWTITSPTEHVVEVTAVEVSNETCCDRLQAIIPSTSTTLMTTGQVITSPGKIIEIDFIANNSVARTGFELSYRAVHVCGVLNYTAEVDVGKYVQQPPFPGVYSSSYLYCWYIVTSPRNTRIRFWIEDFGTQTLARAYYLRFYDGLSDASERFLILSKANEVGNMYHSKSNVMTIKLSAYKPYVYTGFAMTYTAVETCGDTLEASNDPQLLNSPGYPLQHLSDQICTWTITSTTEHVVEVTAVEVSNETCCDQLQAVVSSTSKTQLTTGQVFSSPGKVVEIDFIANSSTQRKGFQLSYRSVHVCGALEFEAVLGEEKQIQQPPFPVVYSTNYLNCWYVMTSPAKTRIRFWIDDFGTVHYSSSRYYLWFYDGVSDVSERFLILTQPSQEGTMQHSKSNVMGIKLYAYKGYTYTGFSMRYKAVDSSCGGVLEALDDPQTLISPNYPLMHSSDEVCTWSISSALNHVVEITTSDVSEESCCEKLQVTDSLSATSTLANTQVYRSPGKDIQLNFISNSSVERNGFELSFRAAHVCGQRDIKSEIGSEKRIIQPGYPGQYEYFMECWYTVRSPEATRIRFKFDDFGTATYNANYFYLWVYDGLDDDSDRFLILNRASDKNIVQYSISNVATFKLRVDRRYITYTGFNMTYSSVVSGYGFTVYVRVNFTLTYRMVTPQSVVAKYRLNENEALDVNDEIYDQMVDDEGVSAELDSTEVAAPQVGVRVVVRVDFRWSYQVYLSEFVRNKYRFLTNQTNDVTLIIFERILAESNSFQLVQVESPVDHEGNAIVIRVGYTHVYHTYASDVIMGKYHFMLEGINDVSTSMYLLIKTEISYVQLIRIEYSVPQSGSPISIRVDFTRVYDVYMSNAIRNKYHFVYNEVNDLSLDVFLMIRRESYSFQLLRIMNPAPHVGITLTLRVDYKLIYTITISQSVMTQYNFAINQTNDISNNVYILIRGGVNSIQLTGYYYEAPSGIIVTIRVDFAYSYNIAITQQIKERYYLISGEINDVTTAVYLEIRQAANSIQLIGVQEPGQFGGISLTIRVDFSGIYRIFVTQQFLEQYHFVINKTNDVSVELYLNIRSEVDAVQLIRVETAVPPVGYAVTVRVDFNRVYQVYLSDDVFQRYHFLIDVTNDITSQIFLAIAMRSNSYQLVRLQSYVPPEGSTVAIRVDYTRVYDVILSVQIKLKYHLLTNQINDISSGVFALVRRDAYVYQFVRIETPAQPNGILIKVRVDYDQAYDIYVSDDIRREFYLSVNTTNDISATLFAEIRYKANSVQLVSVENVGPPEGVIITVRVDFAEVYNIIVSVRIQEKYQLSVEITNDVSESLFLQIKSEAISIQLVNIDVAVSVTVRVDSMWVYQLVISDRLRREYNLFVNVTNDVTVSVYAKLKTETNSVQLIRIEPGDVQHDGTLVTIRVDSNWAYHIYVSASVLRQYNLTVNYTNDVTIEIFLELQSRAGFVQLVGVETVDQRDCPSDTWTVWYNRDSPSGPCDCETLADLRDEYPGQICENPTAFQARLENCKTPFDPALPNIVANVDFGFQCNNEDGRDCLDYEVRFCCPVEP